MNADKRSIKTFKNLIYEVQIPKKSLIIGLLGTVMTTVFALIIPLFVRSLVDGMSTFRWGISTFFFIGVIFFLQAISNGISVYMLTATGEKIVANIREKVLKKILYLPVRYFDNRSTGKIVSHIVNDTSILKDLISDHFPNFISGIISMLGALIILFIIDWKMTLTMLLSVPVILVIILPLGRIMAKISRELQEETGVFSGHVQQTLGEIRLVKSSNGESYQIDKGLNGIKKILNLGLKEARINSLIAPTMYLFIMVVIVVILSYGSIRVANGSMTSGSLVAFLLYLFQIVMPITWLAMFFNQLQKANGASERIIDILHQSVERGHDGQCIDIVDRKLVFDNVSFSYNKKDYVLQNISIEVSPGEVIALVGPSGSGKSTIFSLLERYYEPTKGLIYAGETPISDIKIDYWRNQLGLVSQDSPMMAGTIRENICYGLDSEHISDEDLWRVAKMAYADQFIKSYPDGMDTHVGERGIKLSGGQRQRIAIARAFLRNPSILLMDEATASLDSQSEGVVQDALFNLMQGKTTIIIAHRLSTIINADKIFFIENGQVTASGTHEDLMESHSLYRQFAEIQLVK